MTKAIFIDRDNRLTRCQLVGMNQKGGPEWLVIEQGMESKTLAANQRENFTDPKYRMLCLEGEKLDMLTLMRVLGSAIEGEIKGHGFMIDNIPKFMADMRKHQVEWPKDKVRLIFTPRLDTEYTGKYNLSVYLGCLHGDCVARAYNIDDPNDWMETIRDFCDMLEDEAGMDEPYRELNLSYVGDFEVNENDIYIFNRVVRKD